jgi:hypothetical protein
MDNFSAVCLEISGLRTLLHFDKSLTEQQRADMTKRLEELNQWVSSNSENGK